MSVGISVTLHLQGEVHLAENGIWVATCPAIALPSQGTSPEDARAALEGAARMWVLHLWKRGLLFPRLADRGYEPGDPPAEAEDKSWWAPLSPRALLAKAGILPAGDTEDGLLAGGSEVWDFTVVLPLRRKS